MAEWKQKLNNSRKGSETLPIQQVARIISETNGKINFSVVSNARVEVDERLFGLVTSRKGSVRLFTCGKFGASDETAFDFHCRIHNSLD